MSFCRAHGAVLCLTCHPNDVSDPPRSKRRQMNKTEARYASLLEGLRLAGEIVSYQYEAITLKIGSDCRYTPDFLVIINPIKTRFSGFDKQNHPFNQWWEAHGKYMMSGGGRKEFIWACRGWIAREQLSDGVEVTGESSCEVNRASLAQLPIVEFHEVKGGFTREDSLVKLKSAAQQFPWFLFKLCRYQRGQWDIKEIP